MRCHGKGIYIGPITHLRGLTATLQEIPGDTINLNAQFDGDELKECFTWARHRQLHFTITKSFEEDRRRHQEAANA